MSDLSINRTLLTSTDVARMLGISTAHLSVMRRQPDGGGLPFVRIGGGGRCLRYRLADVEHFITTGGTPVDASKGRFSA